MEKGEGGGVRSVCLRGGGPQPPVISISRRTGVTVQWSSSGRRSVCTHASTHTINTQIYIISIICVSVNQSSPFTSFFFLSLKKKNKTPSASSGTSVSTFFCFTRTFSHLSCDQIVAEKHERLTRTK